MNGTYVPTRFYSLSREPDGTLILYNSLTGALGAVPPGQADAARAALKRSARLAAPLEGITKDLAEGGFLIPEGTDEGAIRQRQYLSKYTEDYLSLIIMPTEECNFRCVYCYESFLRGTMAPELREGVKNFVGGQRGLKRLDLNWFGGEPLVASEVVIELTQHFFRHCTDNNIQFVAGITTNGSLLTEEIARQIIPYGVRYFQITLDGLREDHDHTRVLNGGGDSFDTILANLRMLKTLDYPFLVALRHNITPENHQRIEAFIEMLRGEFAGDPRFTMMFEAVGKWGGPNDAQLDVCQGSTATQSVIDAKRLAIEAGFRSTFLLEQFRPSGYVCYAANPRSFVIGSDGSIYKCTVELDYHDRNIVGKLHPNGTLDLNWRKMALWLETNGLEEGQKCNTCFFSPNCYGAVCPKEWMDTNDVTCPHEKVAIREVLPLIVKQNAIPEPPELNSVLECTRG